MQVPTGLKPFLLEHLTTLERRRTKLYDYQKTFLNDESVFRVVNKARQLGFSVIIAAEAIIESMLFPQHVCLFVSSGEDAAKRVLQYCYEFIRSLPVKPKLLVQSTSEIKLANHSYLVSLPANPKTIRGFRAHRVYIDEAAHFQGDAEIFKAIEPSISRGGKLTVISTPNGRLNRFYEIWSNESSQYTQFSRHEIPYTSCPDEMYVKRVRDLRRNMNPIEFAQEYECKFMEEELALFSPTIVVPCINRTLTYDSRILTHNTIYMGVDFAKMQDETSINVVEHISDTNRVILRYRRNLVKMQYDKQIEVIQAVDKEFGCNKINMDATGVGVRLFEEMEKLYGGKVEGIKFTPDAKHSLINGLRLMFQNQRIEIPYDEELIKQLYAMERTISKLSDTVKYKSAGSKMDDIVWSLAMACKDCFGASGGVNFMMGDTIISHESQTRLHGLSVSSDDPMFDEMHNNYF